MSFKINGQKYRIGLRLAVVATITQDHAAELHDRHIASDAAVWNPADTFDPEKGAKLALTRALKRAFDVCDRTLIWEQIRGKVGKKARKVFDGAVSDDALARL
jgi:hypothetical protein